MEQINRPNIFLAEGLFIYLPEEEGKDLVLEMQRRFPNSELVCELTNRTWVEGFRGKLVTLKMKNRICLRDNAAFIFGVDCPEEFESWAEGIKFLEQWFYSDSNHPKVGWMHIFRNMRIFRNMQYTVRYKLGAV